MMAAPWTRLLQAVFVMVLLHCAGSTDIFDNSIPIISRTASQGETVVLHCNGTEDKGADVGWRKENITLYIYSPYINQTLKAYTSSRMYIDPNNPQKLQISDVQPSDAGTYSCFPLKVHWRLTIEVSGSKPELLRELLLFYIVPSVTGAVALCFIIFCSVWIHRKKKRAGHVDPQSDFRCSRDECPVYENDFAGIYQNKLT
ncbi:hypothetical protein NFI96_021347 [Prochilodus magdalenae]|nr:hypothetical protein NFI96_021347 [Prochilodus magdalenae]